MYVPYVCMPSPVFSDYGFWRIDPEDCRAIAEGAAGLFKTKKREFTEASQLGGLFGGLLSDRYAALGGTGQQQAGTQDYERYKRAARLFLNTKHKHLQPTGFFPRLYP